MSAFVESAVAALRTRSLIEQATGFTIVASAASALVKMIDAFFELLQTHSFFFLLTFWFEISINK